LFSDPKIWVGKRSQIQGRFPTPKSGPFLLTREPSFCFPISKSGPLSDPQSPSDQSQN
jgi:hypothetical protein